MIMQYPVTRTFIDKNTKKRHEKGSLYDTGDSKRATYLQRLGFVGAAVSNDQEYDKEPVQEQEPEQGEAGIKPVGGGNYELPNGERVKGKDKALAALKGGIPNESGEA